MRSSDAVAVGAVGAGATTVAGAGAGFAAGAGAGGGAGFATTSGFGAGGMGFVAGGCRGDGDGSPIPGRGPTCAGAAVAAERGPRPVVDGPSVGRVETAGGASGFAAEGATGAGEAGGAESVEANGQSVENWKDSARRISGSPNWCA